MVSKVEIFLKIALMKVLFKNQEANTPEKNKRHWKCFYLGNHELGVRRNGAPYF